MATVDEPRAGVDGPSPSGASDQALREKHRLYQAQTRRMGPLVTLLLLVLLAAAHVVGWNVSQIDLYTLVHDGPKMGRIVQQLIQPDVLTQDQAQMRASADVIGVTEANATATPVSVDSPVQPLFLAKDQDPIPLTGTQASQVTLTIAPGEVAPGQEVKVSGHFNIPASYSGAKKGDIEWQHFGGVAKRLATFETNANGDFTATFNAPDASQVVDANKIAASLYWGVGDMRLSPTFNDVMSKIIETIFLALMGTTVAVVISLPLSFLASGNIMGKNPVGRAIYYAARTVLNLLRSIEVLIMATIFVAAVGIGPFAGVLALAVHSVASLGKLYSEAIESIDAGPIEAVTATGAGRLQTIVFAIIPQFIPQFISFTLYRWDVNVRMSTIIGFVGGGGIGFLLTKYIQLLDWAKAGTAIWAIAIVVIVIDLASARIRQAVI